MSSRPVRAAAFAAAVLLAACNPGSYPVDLFPEMHSQANHRPLRPERVRPAPDAVPVTGGRVRYTYAEARGLQNPVPRGAASQQQGQALYAVNCVPCHGQSGHGDSPVARYFRDNPAAPVPPTDLASPQVRARSDGELYWIVAHGQGNMPAFGDELMDGQLWTLVLAIRDLQAGG
jgi:mono/diheme cytochrome c family protein